MTLKIQCPCGSKYSFDVEPVNGQMPFAVHCPTCNADGTQIANQLIAEASGTARLRVRAEAVPAPTYETPPTPPPPAPSIARATAMQKIQRGRQRSRMVELSIWGVVLLAVAVLAGWAWFSLVGSKPRLYYAVNVPGTDSSWHSQFLNRNVILMASPNRAIAHDLDSDRDLWSVSLSEKELSNTNPPQTYVDKNSIWICPGPIVVRVDRTTGQVKETVPIKGDFVSFTPTDTSLLVVSAKDETTREACRINLESGEVSTDEIVVPRSEKHEMANDLPSNVQPTAGVLLAQALDDQKFGKPLNAMSSEFFSAGENLVELRVKLLEPKVTFVKSIKKPLTVGGSAADVADAEFNSIKTSETGGVKRIDQSRYEANVRRWMGGAVPLEWKGEVEGVPTFFSMTTVDLLVAGPQLIVFDKQNKKLFDAKLAYPINDRYSPEKWDHQSVPAVEANNILYFFDEGVLTAFSLPSGSVLWRLTSVGIAQVLLDGRGAIYVCSTTANPEDIQYSDEVKLEQANPILLKIDASTGKILWQAEQGGQAVSLTGPYLYTVRAQKGGVALAKGLAEAVGAPEPDAPVYFHLDRVNPDDGKMIWSFYRTHAPSEYDFSQNRFLVRFGSDVQVWKFLTF